jgi:hypothetical protein
MPGSWISSVFKNQYQIRISFYGSWPTYRATEEAGEGFWILLGWASFANFLGNKTSKEGGNQDLWLYFG